jgi:hypothetical protein
MIESFIAPFATELLLVRMRLGCLSLVKKEVKGIG